LERRHFCRQGCRRSKTTTFQIETLFRGTETPIPTSSGFNAIALPSATPFCLPFASIGYRAALQKRLSVASRSTMRNEHAIAVIIPVLNEEASIGQVIEDIPDWVDDIIVVDNGSQDDTGTVAATHGARVVLEPQRGYGAACLCGIAALATPDIVVFLDGDYSDHPEEMALLVDPVIGGEVDMMIGSRVSGACEQGALTPQARFGNWLATRLIRLFWGIRYTDLGPFRAIRYRTLIQLEMADQDYGWTVEMQIKAALQGVPADEIPVSYRKRVGVSKVSGTIRGVVGAGYKILSTIFLSALFAQPTMKTGKLVFFTRMPLAGTTKTRLIPALGPEGAAEQQRKMTEHCLSVAPAFRANIDTCIRYTGTERTSMSAWLGPEFVYEAQGEGDLGMRMAQAFHDGFAQAYGKVVLAGTDCPTLDSALTTEAFAALDDHDIVLGPAEDGGYYLIGMTMGGAPEELEDFFENMAWGTEAVLEDTRQRIAALGLQVRELPSLSDVDYPEDLVHWEAARTRTRIAVIIPTLDEAERLENLLNEVAAIDNSEVIVADGGSTDATVRIAEAHGVKVVSGPTGRARQMNAGAAVAQADILFFLHADTQLPRAAGSWIRRALSFDDVALGAFGLRIDAQGSAFRWIEMTANCRSRALGVPYGDQTFFLRRATFEALGGFRDLPILEDYDLARRAKAHGNVLTVQAKARTSSRRWDREGTVRLTIRNIVTFFAYPLGVAPARIARWYGRNLDG
jgi:uncharacterized protein